jgi:hypothetical protein
VHLVVSYTYSFYFSALKAIGKIRMTVLKKLPLWEFTYMSLRLQPCLVLFPAAVYRDNIAASE